MKIAHFADLHINSSVRDSNIAEASALFGHALESGADHFFLTGDLSHNSEPEDFETLRYLLENYGLLNSKKVSLVIGNHDIYGGPQKAEDIFTFPQTCKEIDYDKKVAGFNYIFRELFEDCIYTAPENIYPYAKIIDDLLVIGINSIDRYSAMKNPFASNGIVDDDQFSEIEKILMEFGESVRHRMVLIHHHFNKIKVPSNSMIHYFWQVVEKQTMKLKNKKPLMELFGAYNVDLVLHGHIHESLSYSRKGIQFLNGGGCFNNKKLGALSYNIIEIHKKHIKTKTISFPFSKKKDKYLFELADVSVPE